MGNFLLVLIIVGGSSPPTEIYNDTMGDCVRRGNAAVRMARENGIEVKATCTDLIAAQPGVRNRFLGPRPRIGDAPPIAPPEYDYGYGH